MDPTCRLALSRFSLSRFSLARFSLGLTLALATLHCSSASDAPPPSPAHVSPPPKPTPTYPPLVTEAGFVDVPAEVEGSTYAGRMFYSFHPAESAGADKPLIVLFNGGPGFATTGGLEAYGTGPMALVDGAPPGALPQKNPASFARFGNLLYIDAKMTGFSYGVGNGTSLPKFGCNFSLVGDASDFARVIVAFLETHPALRAAPVVLVGESYGGARATSILHLLYHYRESSLPIGDDLRSALDAHYRAIFPDTKGTFSPDEIAKQFGAFLLIQPLVLGGLQYTAQNELLPKDPYIGSRWNNPAYDAYDLGKKAGWTDALDARAVAALADEKAGPMLLGVDLRTLQDVLPASRHDAFRIPAADLGTLTSWNAADEGANQKLSARLGALGKDDAYLASMAPSCTDTTDALMSIDMGYWFLDDLRHARLFLTHARWDGVIYTPAIAHVLEQAAIHVTVDTAPRAGFARPGWLRFDVPASDGEPKLPVEIRFPSYDDSGHMVAVTQGTDLADDAEHWLSE